MAKSKPVETIRTMPDIHVRLPATEYAILRDVARLEDRTMASQARLVLKRWAQRQKA